MPQITSGVSRYETLETTIIVNFPVDLKGKLLATCDQCWYYSSSANRCNLTKDACFLPTKYVNGTCPFLDSLQEHCPVINESEDDLK